MVGLLSAAGDVCSELTKVAIPLVLRVPGGYNLRVLRAVLRSTVKRPRGQAYHKHPTT